MLSIFLSIFFSVVSQSLFPTLPAFLSLFVIIFFMVFASIFDMIGVAVTSTSLENLEKYSSSKGFATAKKLCQSREKVSSFCGDVVGDICGILSGAGGVSLVLAMHIQEAGLYFLATCFVSSLIAGLTIFDKAVLKGYAVENCEKVVLATGKVIEFSFADFVKSLIKNRKKKKQDKNNTAKSAHNKKVLKKESDLNNRTKNV